MRRGARLSCCASGGDLGANPGRGGAGVDPGGPAVGGMSRPRPGRRLAGAGPPLATGARVGGSPGPEATKSTPDQV